MPSSDDVDSQVKSDFLIVANRLPVHRLSPEEPWETSPGGLVSALLPILQREQGIWVGWAGAAQNIDQSTTHFEHDGFTNLVIPLTAQEIEDYYQGFSNSTLWPLYHDACQPPHYQRQWWKPYIEVNQRFALAAANAAKDGARVLVQDYHLQLVPGMLRKLRPDLRIGFFLHIPFPPVELFAQLPWRKAILKGLLGADVVGFQTPRGARNFEQLCKRYTPCSVKNDTVRYEERAVKARAFPISIDFERFEKLAADERVIRHSKEIREQLGPDRTIMLGVDRLDYTKGIENRLQAFQEMLSRGGHTVKDITLVQISVPSRESVDEYVELRSRVEELVGQINGEYSELGKIAVHYLRRNFPIDELIAYYLAADIMLVTPLRDGMNLVAKEYVACRHDETGVLVLSEFTGAAHELDQTILVNPHDIDGLVDAFEYALSVSAYDQRERMRRMRLWIKRRTVFDWADEFVGAVDSATPLALNAK